MPGRTRRPGRAGPPVPVHAYLWSKRPVRVDHQGHCSTRPSVSQSVFHSGPCWILSALEFPDSCSYSAKLTFSIVNTANMSIMDFSGLLLRAREKILLGGNCIERMKCYYPRKDYLSSDLTLCAKPIVPWFLFIRSCRGKEHAVPQDVGMTNGPMCVWG